MSNHFVERVEHNLMRSEQDNRDLRVEKIMWESEKRRLENSLEEARSESREFRPNNNVSFKIWHECQPENN